MDMKLVGTIECPIGFTTMGWFEAGVKYFSQKLDSRESTESYFVLGDLTHRLLFRPESVDEEFYISDVEAPEGKNTDFIKTLFATRKLYTDKKEWYTNAYNVAGLKSPKLENLIPKFEEDYSLGASYYNELEKCEGKKVITRSDYIRAANAVIAVKNYPSEQYNIAWDYTLLTSDIRQFVEQEIIWNYEGLVVSSTPDKYIIDLKNKKVINWDLKTTSGPVLKFEESYKKYKYYRQGGIYRSAIFIEHGLDPSEFTFESYITCVNLNTLEVVQYKLDDADLDTGMKEFSSIVQSLKAQIQWNEWEYPIHLKEANYVLPLKLSDDAANTN